MIPKRLLALTLLAALAVMPPCALRAQWVQQSFPSVTLGDVFFTNSNIGWIVGEGGPSGDSGIIGYTTNGGTTWTTQLFGVTEGFASVCFTDANTGWVAGTKGTIIHTINGGISWIRQPSGITTENLLRISFADVNIGWAVGTSGTIIHTTDGGTTWKAQGSGTTNGLYGVFAQDANTAWVVGNGGTILHTTDGGGTWASMSSGTNKLLNAVCFTNPATGTIVGGGDENPLDAATIIHTTDGGVSWTNVVQEQTYGLYSLFFLDANNGWASGSGLTVIHSTDGGASWQSVQSEYTTEAALLGVFFTDSCTGWSVGQGYSTIIQTTSDGANAPDPLPLVSVGGIPSAKPGDTVLIPIFLQSTGNPFWFSSYSFHLNLNRNLLSPIGFVTENTLSQNIASTSFSSSTDPNGVDVQCSLSLPLTQLGTDLSIPLIYLKAVVTLTDSLETYVTIDSFADGSSASTPSCFAPLDIPQPQSSLFQIELSECGDSIIFSALSGDLTASFLSVAPNPVDDNTVSVTYLLGIGGPVELDMMNSQGERIAIPVADESESAGAHTIQLSTSNLSNGAYFLLLHSPNNRYSIAKFQKLQ